METTNIRHFVIIDDDPISNHICFRALSICFEEGVIKTFTDPEEGLACIEILTKDPNNSSIVVLLDINMPEISGWEVLKELDRMADWAKEQLIIYIFSSSVSGQDKDQASNSPLVTQFIEKPLTVAQIKLLFSGDI